jgi:hypothetical protein
MEIDKDRKIETDEEVGLDDDDNDDKIKSETRGLDNMIEDPDKITNL